MNLTPVATDYAVELDKRVQNNMSRNVSAHYLFPAEEYEKRKEVARRIASLSRSTGSRDYLVGDFTELFYHLLPIWQNEVAHDRTHRLTSWMSADMATQFHHQVNKDLYRTIDQFFNDLYGKDGRDVPAMLERIEAGLDFNEIYSNTMFISYKFATHTFPVEWLEFFFTRQRYYIPAVINAFIKGFTPEQVKASSSEMLVFFTPEEVTALLRSFPARQVKQLTSLGSRGQHRLEAKDVADMANAGYQTAKEVKDYARQFGVPFTDATFYTRVVRAKTLYPRLEDYVPVV